MLHALRQSAGSLPAKIFFGALVASFAVWGIGDVFRGGGRIDAVAEIGDSQISSVEFSNSFRRQLNLLRQLNIDAEQAQSLGLHLRLLDTLIAQRLYDLHAGELGVWVSDRALNEDIRSQPAYRDEFGQFDRERFHNALLRDGRSEGAFVEELRREKRREQVIDSLVPGIPPPTILADRLNRWRGERRVARLVTIKSAPATIDLPSGGELDAYHKANVESFTAPELRVVSYVHLSPGEFVDEINVSEQQLRDEYESRVIDLTTPERRTVLQLPLDDKDAAMAASARISDGEAFATVAAELAGGSDLSLGTVAKNDLPVEFADTAFALAEEATSAPVESAFGWHLIHVSKIEPESTPAFEQLRDELKKTIAEESAVDALYAMVNQFEDTLGGGATLEEAAAGLGLRLGRIDDIDRDGNDANGVTFDGLPGGTRIVELAFDVGLGEESTLTETEDGGYLIIRVDATKLPSLRPLAAVRDRVASAWQAEKAQEKALEQARQMTERLIAGATLAEETVERALTVVTSDPFTRNGNGAGGILPLALVGDLFEATLGGVVMTEVDGGAMVAQLSEIQAADLADQSTQDEIAIRLRAEFSGDMLEQLRSELQQRYGVTVNHRAVDALY